MHCSNRANLTDYNRSVSLRPSDFFLKVESILIVILYKNVQVSNEMMQLLFYV